MKAPTHPVFISIASETDPALSVRSSFKIRVPSFNGAWTPHQSIFQEES